MEVVDPVEAVPSILFMGPFARDPTGLATLSCIRLAVENEKRGLLFLMNFFKELFFMVACEELAEKGKG